MSDDHFLAPDAVAIPIKLKVRESGRIGDLFRPAETEQEHITANVSKRAQEYFDALEIILDEGGVSLWMHVLAIGFSPSYLKENGDGVRQDWPRIPLPRSKESLSASAKVGAWVSELLNAEQSLKGITAIPLRPELKVIGNLAVVDGKVLDPPNDLKIDAGWGHKGKGGAIMPGAGQLVVRDYANEERDAIRQGAEVLGMTLQQALALLGEETYDVYLNDHVFWKNIPVRVWDYTIGGYQVIKKWLSYREAKLLGRAITPEEAHFVRDMVRRLTALRLLEPQLDSNYAAAKSATYQWGSAAKAEAVAASGVGTEGSEPSLKEL